MTDSKLPTVPLPRHLHPRSCSAIPSQSKSAGSNPSSGRVASAGGGPDHIFYESDNEGFIVRCITDLHERRDRARASGLCSCGAERALGYRLCPVCHGRERDRQRRQVATSIAVGQCVRNGCVTAAEPGRRKCRRHLDEHAEQQRRRRGAGVGSDNGGFRCAVTRRHSSAGANPARQLSLQPVAVGADDGGNDIG